MGHIVTQLEREFALDHRNMTRGFADVIDALREDQWANAVQLARELDQKGGGHIAFEEKVLYPKVAETRGKDYVRNLYDEHRTAIDALRALITNPDPGNDAEMRKQRLIEQLRTGLDHAVSCGTLLSHLTVLDESAQLKMLEQLRKFREEGKSMLECRPQQPNQE
jgi:hypothetical protein